MGYLRSLALSALITFSCATSWGQPAGGEVRLEVKDPSGAAVAATGKLENLATGENRSFETGAQGVSTISGLAEGRYRLELSKVGFATQSELVDVKSGSPLSRAITLALATQASKIEVVSATPLPGTDLPIDEIPAPVQTVNARDLQNSGALDLSELLGRRLSALHINQNQENPFQPDVNYRGYTASPLLGTPEGISVYMDGVRQNQPFGDIVAWDLIPKIAISEVALIPGSNPLFGLNTLGGAVSIDTKNGYSAPGTMLSINGGSFGRRAGEFEHGGSNAKGLSWYVAGNLFKEDGWRQFSSSEVRQAFAKVGYRHNKTSIYVGFGYADNFLTGNGLQDTRFLSQHYSRVNTVPDITRNHSPSVNLSVRHDVTSNLTFSGTAYFRYIRADTTNGDLNSNSFDESLYNLSAADIAALTAAGYKGFPTTGNATTEPFPYWRCIAQGLEQSEPIEKCNGVITNTYNKQNNWGVSGQMSWLVNHNRVTIGSAWDRGSTIFQQGSQFAYLNPDRLTFTPIDAFADGSSNSNGVPVDTRVDLHGLVNTASFYAADTISLGRSLAFTASGRYNHTSLDNVDRLPIVTDGSRGSLNGSYTFDRFNPAVGFTYSPLRWASMYFS
jgi:outer membrane receptor for Fe3+-dicitrate